MARTQAGYLWFLVNKVELTLLCLGHLTIKLENNLYDINILTT